MGRFTNPRDLYFGEGARHEVKNLKGEKAVIVSGGHSMRRGGFLQDVQKDLEDAGFEVKLFEGVESDPSIETVMKGAKFMQDFGPDWIVAIGGGSPIDAAKAMWVFYEYPDEKFDNIIQPFSFPELRHKAHFCAISSTSGTATEVTAFSVITDYEHGIKYPLADFNITPDVAIVDPELTYSMPQKLCAHTGMDALTHCLEAYVSTAASMFTDADALHGIREITQWLPVSYTGDHEGRKHMHEAQCLAGLAFSSGLLGIVHSMAHKTGAAFENGHIIHGAANAMYLGKAIQWNSKDPRAHERYAYVAKEILHLPGTTDDQLIDSLVEKIRSMNDELHILRRSSSRSSRPSLPTLFRMPARPRTRARPRPRTSRRSSSAATTTSRSTSSFRPSSTSVAVRGGRSLWLRPPFCILDMPTLPPRKPHT